MQLLFVLFFFALAESSFHKTRRTGPGSGVPLIINTWGSDGFYLAGRNAIRELRTGGRMKALVAGLTTCEELQCDTTVGFGGSPDETGETTLDAMLIDTPEMRFGAVADLRRVKSAAKVAWAVMNYTKHTLLVGESATLFAKQMGFQEENLTTSKSEKMHQDWKGSACQPNFWRNVLPDPKMSCGPYKALPNWMISETFEYSNKINEHNHDTIGMVVVDENNLISAGTSTNGASHKIPGRVGDSPIPGAGAYANTFAGAAATGDGDVMMRFLPSYEAVRLMTSGTKPTKAAQKAIHSILQYYPRFQGAVVAANKKGEYGAACANLEGFKYTVSNYLNGTVIHTVNCFSYSRSKPSDDTEFDFFDADGIFDGDDQ